MNKYKLNELGAVARGKSKHRPRNDPQLFDGQYPFIQTGDVKHAPLYITSHSQTYNEKGLGQSKLWPEGTLCITIAANIADTAILSYPACFPDSVIGFNAFESVADTRYVKYCLDTFQLQMRSISQGTTQDNMSLEKLLSINFPAPELSQQRKVAAILTSYDDLIENNKRRITLLEKMTEEIYREWFVRFRFPGWQEAEFEKGLPVGWPVKKLSDILSLQYGKALKNEDRLEGAVPVYGSSGVVGFHNEAFVQRPGIIVGRKGNVGAIHWSDVAFYPIDTVYFVESDLSEHFLYYLLHSVNFINNDAAVPGLNRKQAYSNHVLVPDGELIDQFDRLVKPLYEQKKTLTKMSDNLEKTKTQLLSRLISGKLSVENLDIQFPPSMQNGKAESPVEAVA
ncbi:restriction endonuclease subunit S [Marinobacter maritimus]|uniref:restriction endonuclease subunit S n=1 Tax=Marinobacter maritimus TaxID=277961 RepID=UPI00119D3035|nr:restriction endonuclease subunit S [Marinobacter maritimus]